MADDREIAVTANRTFVSYLVKANLQRAVLSGAAMGAALLARVLAATAWNPASAWAAALLFAVIFLDAVRVGVDLWTFKQRRPSWFTPAGDEDPEDTLDCIANERAREVLRHKRMRWLHLGLAIFYLAYATFGLASVNNLTKTVVAVLVVGAAWRWLRRLAYAADMRWYDAVLFADHRVPRSSPEA